MWKALLRRAQPVFLILALIFVALLLRSQWEELRTQSWQLRPGWLAASSLLLLASWAMEIGIWRRLLSSVGGRLAYWPAVRIWFLSAIMRYIPGNVWQPLSMTLQCQRRGVRVEATLTSVALYQAIILLAVGPIAAVYMLVTGNLGVLTDLLGVLTPALAALVLAPVLVLLVRPELLTAFINWALHKLGRATLEMHLTSGRLFAFLVVAVLNWGLWGASFAALTFALGEYSQAEMAALAPHLIVAYPIAYAIGFVSFLTPSGFGVREGAFYLLLAPLVGGGVITVAALAMRLWTTAGELGMAALSVALIRGPAKRAPASTTGTVAVDERLHESS